MKRILVAALLCTAFPCGVVAQTESGPPNLHWGGFELFSYVASKFQVEWIGRFGEMETRRKGLLVILGGQNALPWGRINEWVRQGGSLLVACDDRPFATMERSVANLTGYTWAGIALKQGNPSGLDELPNGLFAGNHFIIPVNWRKTKPSLPGLLGLSNLFSETPPQKAFLNTPTFLLRAQGGESTVIGRFPNRMMMVTDAGESPLPLAPPPFVTMTQVPGGGVVMQLSNTRVFSNQMLELKENAEFAWWVLEKLLPPGEEGQTSPTPVMFVVNGRVQAPYVLPSQPLPLPDVDPYTAMSLGARALDEVLPQWENKDGPIPQFSERIAGGNFPAKIVSFLAVALGVFGLYQLLRMRGRLRVREISQQPIPPGRKDPTKQAAPFGGEQAELEKELEKVLARNGLPVWLLADLRWEVESGPEGKKDARSWELCKKDLLAWVGAPAHRVQSFGKADWARIRQRLEVFAQLLKKREIKAISVRVAPGEKTA